MAQVWMKYGWTWAELWGRYRWSMVAGMDDLKMKYKKINTRNMNSMDELWYFYILTPDEL